MMNSRQPSYSGHRSWHFVRPDSALRRRGAPNRRVQRQPSLSRPLHPEHGAELDPAVLLRATRSCLRQTLRLCEEQRPGRSAAPDSGIACSALIGPETHLRRSLHLGRCARHGGAAKVCAQNSTNRKFNNGPAACCAPRSGRRNSAGCDALSRNFSAVSHAGFPPQSGFSKRFGKSAPAATRWPARPGSINLARRDWDDELLEACWPNESASRDELHDAIGSPGIDYFPGDRRWRGRQSRLGRDPPRLCRDKCRDKRRGPRRPAGRQPAYRLGSVQVCHRLQAHPSRRRRQQRWQSSRLGPARTALA